jgi:hypothetical protein
MLISEKTRPQKSSESSENSESSAMAQKEKPVQEEMEVELTPEQKLDKIQKLKALQSELEALKTKETQIDQPIDDLAEDGLEILESTLSKSISSATKGERVANVLIDDVAIEREMAALEREVAAEEQIIVDEKTAYEKLLEIHDWLEQAQYGFMYVMPKKKDKQDFESWREEWSQVLFDYAKVGKLHILYIKRLLSEQPFNKFDNRKLAINFLAERLVEKELAEWTGHKPKKKEELRIYWKSLTEWRHVIEKWAGDNAILEVIMIPDIRKSNTDFANLPEQDLRTIFKRIEKDAKGQCVELENNQIGIKFNLI